MALSSKNDDQERLAAHVVTSSSVPLDDSKDAEDKNPTDSMGHPAWTGEAIPIRIDTVIKNLSKIDSVNQTFRCKLHVYVYRQLSPEEEDEFKRLEDKNDFTPHLTLIFEPQFTADILRFEQMVWNNGLPYIYGFHAPFDTVCVGYFWIVDCIFLEDLELINFPFDIQHLEMQFEFCAELQNNSLGLYPFCVDLDKSWVSIDKTAADIVGWKFLGLEYGVEQPVFSNDNDNDNEIDRNALNRRRDNIINDILNWIEWKGGKKRFMERYHLWNSCITGINGDDDDDKESKIVKTSVQSVKRNCNKGRSNLSVMYFGVYSHFYFRMKFQRQWQFFFTRVVVVLGILSFLSLFCFTFGEDTIPDRFGFVSTMLLAGVAYMFIIVSFIPALNYLTLLDQYVYFTFAFLLFLGIENGVLSMLIQFSDYFEENSIFYDYMVLIFDFILWIICHLYFYNQSLKANKQEIAKIEMTKEMVEEEKEKKEKEKNDKNEKEDRGNLYHIGGNWHGDIDKYSRKYDFKKDKPYENQYTVMNAQLPRESTKDNNQDQEKFME